MNSVGLQRRGYSAERIAQLKRAFRTLLSSSLNTSQAVAKIKAGLQDKLLLGNLDARRDWGYAAEYVEAMWSMLQQRDPHDYVIATGESHSVEELAAAAFAEFDLDYREHIVIDRALMRPAELHYTRGDATRASCARTS